ncbi:hypothetical protein A5821_001314 [Enterococcus sp. 7F3_DIV0205]|uniref:CENP-V/GFA domain-containing protein n=1 Tax=Candidatus Enterococcus palustris TaxID=1834189 RepID=A0AAQ3Y766_9ENTE|nr:GFA family protein [Enterococcus sp. 7F3_DIV0205]OTN85712.1 hypothetical protein A5821_001658 [Enterococcus sp. 7F3_DIV0205]
MDRYKGACFCEAVQFELNLKNLDLTICHCSMCRKLTGSTGFASLEAGESLHLMNTDGLSILDSSTVGERAFCNKCGTSLFYRFKSSNEYFVPPAIISDLPEENIKLIEEIFYDNKPCYYEFSNNTIKKNEADFQ